MSSSAAQVTAHRMQSKDGSRRSGGSYLAVTHSGISPLRGSHCQRFPPALEGSTSTAPIKQSLRFYYGVLSPPAGPQPRTVQCLVASIQLASGVQQWGAEGEGRSRWAKGPRVKCMGAEVRNVCLTALYTTLFPRKASQTQRYNDKYGRQLHGFCALHSC